MSQPTTRPAVRHAASPAPIRASAHTPLRTLARAAAALALVLPWLAGCALTFIEAAPARGGRVAEGTTVIEGRINYFVDGTSRAPYGTFRPKWLAPRFFAQRLESDTTFVSPPVDDDDGSFRWALPPGSYVLTRIGTGTYTDDTYIAWPRVALCVPAVGGTPQYAGHLRLLGQTPNETMVLSTGRVVRFTALRYTFEVVDERPPAAGAPARPAPLWRVLADFPSGDRFVQQMAGERASLVERACGKPASG